MAAPLINNDYQNVLASSSEGCFDDIFGPNFDYTLSPLQGSSSFESTGDSTDHFGDCGNAGLKDLHEKSTSPSSGSGTSPCTYKVWRGNFQQLATPKSSKVAHRPRAETRSISSSDLLSIEGKRASWMAPATALSQLASTPSTAPFEHRSRSQTPGPCIRGQLARNKTAGAAQTLAMASDSIPNQVAANRSLLFSVPYRNYTAPQAPQISYSTPPSPLLSSESLHGEHKSSLDSNPQWSNPAGGRRSTLSTGGYTSEAFMESFPSLDYPMTDLSFSSNQNWQANMPSFELTFGDDHINNLTAPSMWHGVDSKPAAESAHLQYHAFPESEAMLGGDYSSVQSQQADPVDWQSDFSDSPDQPRGRAKAAYGPRCTSAKPSPGARSQSRVLKNSRSSKSMSRCRSDTGAAAGFVNFTASDSQKILTAVAPSGSSKTKARRDREASERRRKIGEAAAKAIRDVGGDPEALIRQGLLDNA